MKFIVYVFKYQGGLHKSYKGLGHKDFLHLGIWSCGVFANYPSHSYDKPQSSRERERECVCDGVTGIRQQQFVAIRDAKTYSKKGKEP